MTQISDAHPNGLEAAFTLLLERSPAHAALITAMRPLILARSALAAALPSLAPEVDFSERALFLQGAPLVPKNRLPLAKANLEILRQGLLPALCQGFPKIAEELRALDAAFAQGKLRLTARLGSYLRKAGLPRPSLLASLGASRQAAELYLSQIIKTQAESLGLELSAKAELTGWTRGYCPICGSQAEISALEGKEGRRMLYCALCSSKWNYTRVACPFCESEDHKDIELLHIDGKLEERAETCAKCRRYVLGVDRRADFKTIPAVLEPLRLTHLDILAQERGFVPAALEAAVAS